MTNHSDTTIVSQTVRESISKTKIAPFDNFRENYQRKGMLHSDLADTGRGKTQLWQFVHKTTKLECTVKVIPKTLMGGKDKFLKEVAVLKECCGHPNLQQVIEAYQCPKFYYVVTESLNYPTVLETLAKSKTSKIDPRSIGTIIRVMLNALVYLHDHQSTSKMHNVRIVHGNINPKTVLVPPSSDRDGFSNFHKLLLVDFSHAILLDGEDKDIEDSEEDSDDNHHPKQKHHHHNTKKRPERKRSHKPNRFHPPEYAKTGPTQKGDMWSLGVLTFLLMTGKFPFSKPSQTREGVPDWYSIKSQRIQDFVSALLAHKPEDRPTAIEINQRNDFVLAIEGSESQDGFKDVMVQLSGINKEYEFKKAVRSYISANLLQASNQERLSKIFQMADFNNDNALSRTEFQRAMLEANIDIPLESIDNFFKAVDVNGDKKISYSEFMAFAEKEEVLFEKAKLKAAFDAFDWSNTGYITKADLHNFSKSAGGASAFRGDGALEEETIEYMMDEADKNGDGKITFEEFCDMMVKQPYFQVFSW